MDYKATWHVEALEDIKQIDRVRQKAIIEKVKSYLLKDPLNIGKQLSGRFKGLYRLRFENYRIIYAVNKEEMKVLIGSARH